MRWFEYPEWVRDGRGRTAMFSLPKSEIVGGVEALAKDLGTEIFLVTCSRVGGEQGAYSTFTCDAISSLGEADSWVHFLGSRALTPRLPAASPRKGVGWPGLFSTSGLINLAFPYPSTKRNDLSELSIVQRVRNLQTGESVEHAGYDRLYAQLKQLLFARQEMLGLPKKAGEY